jgi:hypothetical protein
MSVLARVTCDGENHLLTNQSQLEFAAVEVRTRASPFYPLAVKERTGTENEGETGPA